MYKTLGILLCFLGFYLTVSGQVSVQSPFLTMRLKLATLVVADFNLSDRNMLLSPKQSPTLFKQKSSFTLNYEGKLNPSYGCNNYEDLAVFCKIEYKLEKAFKIPVKIRLGEVHYTEQREGKKGYAPE